MQVKLFNLSYTTPTPEISLAFNASEISGVGVVYDRLNNFLTNIANQQKSAEATK